MTEIEGAAEVRDEDAFDVDAVTAWLREQGTDVGRPVEVRQFAGGASNLTYSLRTPSADLILRRPPTGQKARGAHDMSREYRIQDALREPFGLVARMVALCQDEAVIGSDFYVMERIDGVIPRRELPPGVDLGEDAVRRLCTRALDVLIRLHRIDPDSSADLRELGKGTGYVRRQVEGWSTRFRNARTEDVGDYEAVMAWLDQHQPDDVATLRDPQRLPLRQPRARPRRPDPGGRRPGLGDGHPGRPADGPRRHPRLLGAGRRRRVLPAVPPAADAPARHALEGRGGPALLRRDGLLA